MPQRQPTPQSRLENRPQSSGSASSRKRPTSTTPTLATPSKPVKQGFTRTTSSGGFSRTSSHTTHLHVQSCPSQPSATVSRGTGADGTTTYEMAARQKDSSDARDTPGGNHKLRSGVSVMTKQSPYNRPSSFRTSTLTYLQRIKAKEESRGGKTDFLIDPTVPQGFFIREGTRVFSSTAPTYKLGQNGKYVLAPSPTSTRDALNDSLPYGSDVEDSLDKAGKRSDDGSNKDGLFVRCMAPIGNDQLWVAQRDCKLAIYDVKSGRKIHQGPRTPGLFASVVLPVASEVWVGFSDGCIRVFDPTGKTTPEGDTNNNPLIAPIKEMKEHAGSVTCLAKSIDATLVFSASEDFMIFRWDAIAGVKIGMFTSHTAPVSSLHVHMTRLFSGDSKGTLCEWDGVTWEGFGSRTAELGYNDAHHEGQVLHGTTTIPQHECIRSLPRAHKGQINAIISTPQHLWTGGSEGVVRIWSLSKEVNVIMADLIERHSSANRGAVTRAELEAELAEAAGEVLLPIHTIAHPHTGPVTSLTCVGGAIWSSANNGIFRWDAATFERVEPRSGATQLLSEAHAGFVQSVTVSHSAVVSRVWTAGTEGGIVQWDSEGDYGAGISASRSQQVAETDAVIAAASKEMQKARLVQRKAKDGIWSNQLVLEALRDAISDLEKPDAEDALKRPFHFSRASQLLLDPDYASLSAAEKLKALKAVSAQDEAETGIMSQASKLLKDPQFQLLSVEDKVATLEKALTEHDLAMRRQSRGDKAQEGMNGPIEVADLLRRLVNLRNSGLHTGAANRAKALSEANMAAHKRAEADRNTVESLKRDVANANNQVEHLKSELRQKNDVLDRYREQVAEKESLQDEVALLRRRLVEQEHETENRAAQAQEEAMMAARAAEHESLLQDNHLLREQMIPQLKQEVERLEQAQDEERERRQQAEEDYEALLAEFQRVQEQQEKDQMDYSAREQRIMHDASQKEDERQQKMAEQMTRLREQEQTLLDRVASQQAKQLKRDKLAKVWHTWFHRCTSSEASKHHGHPSLSPSRGRRALSVPQSPARGPGETQEQHATRLQREIECLHRELGDLRDGKVVTVLERSNKMVFLQRMWRKWTTLLLVPIYQRRRALCKALNRPEPSRPPAFGARTISAQAIYRDSLHGTSIASSSVTGQYPGIDLLTDNKVLFNGSVSRSIMNHNINSNDHNAGGDYQEPWIIGMSHQDQAELQTLEQSSALTEQLAKELMLKQQQPTGTSEGIYKRLRVLEYDRQFAPSHSDKAEAEKYWHDRERTWGAVGRGATAVLGAQTELIAEASLMNHKIKTLSYYFITRPTLVKALLELYKVLGQIQKVLDGHLKGYNRREPTRQALMQNGDQLMTSLRDAKEGNRWIVANLFTLAELQHLGARIAEFEPDNSVRRPQWRHIELPQRAQQAMLGVTLAYHEDPTTSVLNAASAVNAVTSFDASAAAAEVGAVVPSTPAPLPPDGTQYQQEPTTIISPQGGAPAQSNVASSALPSNYRSATIPSLSDVFSKSALNAIQSSPGLRAGRNDSTARMSMSSSRSQRSFLTGDIRQ